MTKMTYRSRITRVGGNTLPWASMTAVILCLFTAAALLLPAVVRSDSGEDEDHDHDHEQARQLRHEGKIVSLESIVKQAQSIKAGNILEIELKNADKSYLYEVEILDPDGKVWELLFDGATGKLIQTQQEH